MIIFGIAEIVTGFRHNFLGIIVTAKEIGATYGAVIIGSLYAGAGLLLWMMKKGAAIVAEISLVLVVLGRIALVVAGIYPINSFLQTISILIGTAIVAIFAIYIGLNWNCFR